MCNFASGILTKDKEFWCDTSDSHEDIIQEHGLHEDGVQGPNLLKYELEPPANGKGFFDLTKWEFKIDQDVKPEWIKGDEEERARAAFLRRFPDFIKHKLSADGDLNLHNLTMLPANAKLSAGGDLYLRSLTSLPADARLSAGGGLYLRSLTSLPANAKLSAGGSLYLNNSLKDKDLPAGIAIKGRVIYY